mgnify:FL=1
MTPKEKYRALGENFLKIYRSPEYGPEVAQQYLASYNLDFESLNKAIDATDDETTFSEFIDQVQEGFKGIIPGAAGTIETGVVGASALAPDEGFITEKGIRDTASDVLRPLQEFAAPEAGFEESTGRKIGEGLGSFLSFVGLGLIPGFGKAGLAGFAAATGAGEARLRAEAENATPEQISDATFRGTFVGLSEALAPAKVLGRIKRTKEGATAVNKAVDRISSAAITGGIEGAQEAAAGIAQNFIAQDIYKPEQELVEGLGENFTIGATVGVIAQGLFDLAIPRATKTAKATTEEKPATQEDTEPAKMPTVQEELFPDDKKPSRAELSKLSDKQKEINKFKRADFRDLEKEQTDQFIIKEIKNTRDEFDMFQRENQRLEAAFNKSKDTAERNRLGKLGQENFATMATLEQKINTLKEQAAKRRIAKSKYERPTTPKGQAELDFSGTLEDTRDPVKAPLPKATALGGLDPNVKLTPEQEDFFIQERTKAAVGKKTKGEVLSAEEKVLTDARDREIRQTEVDLQQTGVQKRVPPLVLKSPEDVVLGTRQQEQELLEDLEGIKSIRQKQLDELEQEIANTTDRNAKRRLQRRFNRVAEDIKGINERLPQQLFDVSRAKDEAVPTPEAPQKITEADFKEMGIGPTNKSLRKKILGKDLDNPNERAEVRDALNTYVQTGNKSEGLRNRVESYLSKPVFAEQLSLGLPQPVKETIDDRRREITPDSERAVLGDAASVAPGPSPETITAPVGERVDTGRTDTRQADVRKRQVDPTLEGEGDLPIGEVSRPVPLEVTEDFKKAFPKTTTETEAVSESMEGLGKSLEKFIKRIRKAREEKKEKEAKKKPTKQEQQESLQTAIVATPLNEYIQRQHKTKTLNEDRELEYFAADLYVEGRAKLGKINLTDVETGPKRRVNTIKYSGLTKTERTVLESLNEEQKAKVDNKVLELIATEEKANKYQARLDQEKETKVAELKEGNTHVKAIVKIKNEIIKDWKNAPRIDVVPNENRLPAKIQTYLENKRNEDLLDDDKRVRGVFDAETNTVYLVANALKANNQQVAETILHESIGHFGLRAVLGDKYSETMQNIYKNGNKELQQIVNTMMQTEGLSKESAVEELIADSAEKLASGKNIISTLKSLVNKTVAFIKKFLRDNLGIKISDNKTVEDLVAKSLNFVINGRKKKLKRNPYAAEIMLQSVALDAPGTLAIENLLSKNISNKGNNEVFKEFVEKNSSVTAMKGFFSRAAARIEVEVGFKGASVERKLKKLYNGAIRNVLGDIRPDLFLTMAEHSDTLGTAVMKQGKLMFSKETGWQAVKDKDSLFEAYQQIADFGQQIRDPQKAMDVVSDVLVAVRASELKKYRKDIPEELLPSQDAINAGLKVREMYPQIQKIENTLKNYRFNLIDALVEAGSLSKDKADLWKEASGYIPWNRIKDEDISRFEREPKKVIRELATRTETRALKGSKSEINNVMSNMVGLSFWMVNSAVRNHAALSLVDTFAKPQKDGGLATYEKGVLVEGAKKVKGIAESASQDQKDRTVQVYRNGKREFYEFADVLDVYAFKGLEVPTSKIIDGFTLASNALRKGVTAMPEFAFSQLFQDASRAYVLSGTQNPFRTASGVVNPLAYFSSRFLKDPTIEKLRSFGITGSYDLMHGKAQKEIMKEFNLNEKKPYDALLNPLSKTFDFLENFSIASDANLRKAIYEQTLRETKSERFPDGDILEARYRAQEIINFKRQGANKTVAVARQIVPFLNAYIQGMSVYYRTMMGEGITNQEKRAAFNLFLSSAAKLTALSFLYATLVAGDEEYEAQEDYIKNKNFFIPGTPLKIPVAPEIGFLFKVLPERTYSYIASQGTERPQDATKFLEAMRTALVDSFSGPNLTPQLLKTPVELLVNYSFFRDAPIVPTRLKNLEEELQFTSSTSEFSKFIAPYMLGNPIQIDYFIKGMFGILGGNVLYATNLITAPNRRDFNYYEIPIVKTFTRDAIPSGLKSEFYALRDDMDRVADSIRQLSLNPADADNLIEYLSKDNNYDKLYISKILDSVQRQLSMSRRAKRDIEASKDLSSEEKQELVNRIDEHDNMLIRSINIPKIRKFLGY